VAGPVKRSVTIAGHRTSISLEPKFWDLLKRYADATGQSLSSIVNHVDAEKTSNLSSALRVFLVERAIQRPQVFR